MKKRRLRKDRLVLLILAAVLLAGAVGYGGYRVYASLNSGSLEEVLTDSTAPVVEGKHAKEVSAIKNGLALDKVDVTGFTDEELRACFYTTTLDDKLLERLNNMGYEGNESMISTEDVRYVRVLYKDFDGNNVIGEIMVSKEISDDIEEIFYDLFMHSYQIGKMILPDAYGNSLSESYSDNNTIGLCFGLSAENNGTTHAYGLAVDINPVYNPMVRDNGTTVTIFPTEGQLYLDRTLAGSHFITEDDYAKSVFEAHGFVWLGTDSGKNDYKHFEKANAASIYASRSASSTESTEETSQSTDTAQDPVQSTDQTTDDAAQDVQEQSTGEETWTGDDSSWSDDTSYEQDWNYSEEDYGSDETWVEDEQSWDPSWESESEETWQ